MNEWCRAVKKAQKDPTSLGNLLIREGLCTREDIIEALSDEWMLGESLVRRGKISSSQLEIALTRQAVARGRGNGAVRKLADSAIKQAKESGTRLGEATLMVSKTKG